MVFGKKLLPEDAVAELGFNPKKLPIPRPLKDKLLAIKRGKDDGQNKMYFDNFADIMQRRQDAMELVQQNTTFFPLIHVKQFIRNTPTL